MNLKEFQSLKLPDQPGIYRFLGKGREILYIGKATSLKDRVRSYFSATVMTRGPKIEQMVIEARTIEWTVTDSVLEALVLEAALIKKHQPPANAREKDNKSFNYLVITDETYPRVLVIRERTMLLDGEGKKRSYKHIFGPFPSGGQLKEALAIVRKIFPFRDTCTPESGKPCFNRQIGLCPGVCSGEITKGEYGKIVAKIRTFFSGKKKDLLRLLKKEMHADARMMRFESAAEKKRQVFALEHINDVALIRDDVRNASLLSSGERSGSLRIEAYDIAHLGGKATVGAMVVVEGGETNPSAYRKFRLKGEFKDESHDPGNLREILKRRFNHPEWPLPGVIVVDGNLIQKGVAEEVVAALGLQIPVVAVTKNEFHRPKSMVGIGDLIEIHKKAIILANQEAHRFAIGYHRKSLRKTVLSGRSTMSRKRV